MSKGIRRAAMAALTVFLVMATAVVAGLPVYVFPRQDVVTSADVAFVLGPPWASRVDRMQAMIASGQVERGLISVATEGPLDAEQIEACSYIEVDCATPNPFTTIGEVQLLAEYAQTYPADSVVVLTMPSHVARARYLFEKCYPGTVSVVAIDLPLTLEGWARQYIYQSAAFVKAWSTSCEPGG